MTCAVDPLVRMITVCPDKPIKLGGLPTPDDSGTEQRGKYRSFWQCFLPPREKSCLLFPGIYSKDNGDEFLTVP